MILVISGAKIGPDECGAEMQSERAHAPFGVAADVGREPGDRGDERGLGEITEVEISRPGPILGLVEEQVRPREHEYHQPDREQGDKESKQPGPIVLLPKTLAPGTRSGGASGLDGWQRGSRAMVGVGDSYTMVCAETKACY